MEPINQSHPIHVWLLNPSCCVCVVWVWISHMWTFFFTSVYVPTPQTKRFAARSFLLCVRVCLCLVYMCVIFLNVSVPTPQAKRFAARSLLLCVCVCVCVCVLVGRLLVCECVCLLVLCVNAPIPYHKIKSSTPRPKWQVIYLICGVSFQGPGSRNL